MIKQKLRLLPRYNWDYGIREFLSALTASVGISKHSDDSILKVFGQTPLYTTSGRTSLYTILKSLDLPPGARVGVPLFCCSVVFDVIKRADLRPIFLDINLDDYNVSAIDLRRKVSSLSAMIVVHMFGHPAEMDSIKSAASGIPIIEDCAQSLFSEYKGEYTGFLGTASFFSFRSGKYVSAGEGSAIFCGDHNLKMKIAEHVTKLRRPSVLEEASHCTSTYIKSMLYKRPWYGTVGYPMGKRLDKRLNLTAKSGFKQGGIADCDFTIINRRIERFVRNIDQQREHASYLLNNLKGTGIELPFERADCVSNYYQFAVRFSTQQERDSMANDLWRNGIDSPRYLDDIIDVAREYYSYSGDCPNGETCSKTVLIIPHYYTLSKEDIIYIAKCFNDSIL